MEIKVDDIRRILASVYYDACLDPAVEMQYFVPYLEDLSTRILEINSPDCWEQLKLDGNRFGRSPYIDYLNRFKKAINAQTAENTLRAVQESNSGKNETWLAYFAAALVAWDTATYNALVRMPTEGPGMEHIAKYRKLVQLIADDKWRQAYPYYQELAENDLLTLQQRSLCAYYAGQIRLYWLSKQETTLSHFERAKDLFPQNHKAERGIGEYYLKANQPEKARSYFLSALAMSPNDVDSHLYLGDSYKYEDKPEIAFKWYQDALQINFLSANVYARLIDLYSHPAYEQSQQEEIKKIIDTASRIFEANNDSNELHNLLRDAGSSLGKMLHYGDANAYYQRAIELMPQLSSARIDLAFQYGYEKKYAAAERLFEEALISDAPEYKLDVYFGLAWLYQEQGDFEKAISTYESCLAFTTEIQDRIYNYIGIIHFDARRYSEAALWYMKAIDDNPFDVVYYDNCRRAYEEDRDAASLEALYKKAVTYLKEDATYPNFLAVIHHNRNEYAQAISLYDRAIEVDQNRSLYFKNRALAHEALQLSDEAERDYRQAYALEPAPETAHALGTFLARVNKFEPAIRYLQEAVEKGTSPAASLAQLAYCYEKTGDLVKAEEYLKQALAADPGPVYQNKLGLFYYNNHRNEDAITFYKKAVALDPSYATYEDNLMLALVQAEKYADALPLAKKIFARDPANSVMLDYLVYCKIKLSDESGALQVMKDAEVNGTDKLPILKGIGTMQERARNYRAACATYEYALELDPRNDYFADRSGVCYGMQGGAENYTRALEYFNEAIRLNPNNGIYQVNLGTLYQLMGDFEQAERSFDGALNTDPDNAEVCYNIGQYYASTKRDFDTAISLLAKAVDLAPAVSEYKKVLANVYETLGETEKAAQYLTQADSSSNASQ